MRVAREKLRAKRVAAAKSKSKMAKSMVDKAYNAVARNIVALDEAERKLHSAKANVKIEKLRQQVGDAELKAQTKILELEKNLPNAQKKNFSPLLRNLRRDGARNGWCWILKKCVQQPGLAQQKSRPPLKRANRKFER